MSSREEAYKKFVEEYDIEVPEEKLENEYRFIRSDIKHRMQYAQMSGEEFHAFPEIELMQQEEELRRAAYIEAKSDLVMKELMKRPEFDVTPEELQAEGERLAKEEGSTIEMIKRFFGEDLSGLTRDVKERKIRDWIYQNSSEG